MQVEGNYFYARTANLHDTTAQVGDFYLVSNERCVLILMFIEKIMKKIEVYRANAEALSVQENNLNIEEKIGKYEIVSDSITSEMYLRWGNETWKYLMYENNGGTEENFYKTLIDTDVSSLIAFQ